MSAAASQVSEAVAELRRRGADQIDAGVILGTGLCDVADAIEDRERLGTAVIGEAEFRLRLARNAAESQPPDAAVASSHLSSAESLLGHGITTLTTVISNEPGRAGPRHDLAGVYLLIGRVKERQGDPIAARAAWVKGCEVLEPLKDEFDRNRDCAERWSQLEESLKLRAPPQAM